MLKLIHNDPIDFEILKMIYEDPQDLQKAWPDSKYPLCVEEWTHFLNTNPDHASLLFTFNGEVAGHLILKANHQQRLFICFVIVTKKFRGQGLVDQMLEQAEDFAIKKFNYEKLWLHVAPENFTAVKAYERSGFKTIEETDKGRYRMNKPIKNFSYVQYTEQKSKSFFELLKQLRPHLDFENFLELLKEAQGNGYQLLGMKDQDQNIVALMGYRVMTDFVHGRHLYIDDLVTSENNRSQGYGGILLKHAEELAKELGCSNLRLCTGIENEGGKKFYAKNVWNLRAVVYKKKI
jgi:ribosomal protein S18 acetylase RimI-like enzyme